MWRQGAAAIIYNTGKRFIASTVTLAQLGLNNGFLTFLLFQIFFCPQRLKGAEHIFEAELRCIFDEAH